MTKSASLNTKLHSQKLFRIVIACVECNSKSIPTSLTLHIYSPPAGFKYTDSTRVEACGSTTYLDLAILSPFQLPPCIRLPLSSIFVQVGNASSLCVMRVLHFILAYVNWQQTIASPQLSNPKKSAYQSSLRQLSVPRTRKGNTALSMVGADASIPIKVIRSCFRWFVTTAVRGGQRAFCGLTSDYN